MKVAGASVVGGLSLLLLSCGSQKPFEPSKSQAKGKGAITSSERSSESQTKAEIAITFEGYSNKDTSGWHAIAAVENRSPDTLQCLAHSRAVGLESGAEAEVAESLDVNEMPRDVGWALGEPDSMPPEMMKRYGAGQFFVLQPGEKRVVELPIYVPVAHPEKFTEHLVIGYKKADAEEYEYYIAKLNSR